MPVYEIEVDELPKGLRGCAVTIGNFDGVHLGHQALLKCLKSNAKSIDGAAVAISFDPPPSQLLRPDNRPPALSTLARRIELMQTHGAEHVVILKTSHRLLQLSAREFFEQILVEKLGAKSIVEGSNFRFGKARAGNVQTLKEFCSDHVMQLEIVDDQFLQEQPISSSAIRSAIVAGDLPLANAMLGRPHELVGVVAHGHARGRTIGFPTANLEQIGTLLPSFGVYAAIATTNGQTFPAAVHIGPNVTFNESIPKVECFLIGYQGDLYGQNLPVVLLSKLREAQRFSGVEPLVAQMKIDVERAKSIVAEVNSN